jgi:fatty acid synthase
MLDGRVLFPATRYLQLAWRALAKISGQMYEQMPVAFENVHIHRATILPKSGRNFLTVHFLGAHNGSSIGSVKFLVTITPVSGQFEVSESDGLVVSGRIYVPNSPVLEVPVYENRSLKEEEVIHLTTSDIYKELRLRGYDYGGMFQGILSATNKGTFLQNY